MMQSSVYTISKQSSQRKILGLVALFASRPWVKYQNQHLLQLSFLSYFHPILLDYLDSTGLREVLTSVHGLSSQVIYNGSCMCLPLECQ